MNIERMILHQVQVIYFLVICLLFISSFHHNSGYHRECNSRVFKSHLNALSHEQEQKLKELSEPLLNIELVKKTIKEWSEPLPLSYLTRPLVIVGVRSSMMSLSLSYLNNLCLFDIAKCSRKRKVIVFIVLCSIRIHISMYWYTG